MRVYQFRHVGTANQLCYNSRLCHFPLDQHFLIDHAKRTRLPLPFLRFVVAAGAEESEIIADHFQ